MKFHCKHVMVDHRGESFKVPESPEEEQSALREGRAPKMRPLHAGSIIANHILSSQHAPKDKVARVSLLAMRLEGNEYEELTDEDCKMLKDMILADERLSVWFRGYLAWRIAPDSYTPEERMMFEGLQGRDNSGLAS